MRNPTPIEMFQRRFTRAVPREAIVSIPRRDRPRATVQDRAERSRAVAGGGPARVAPGTGPVVRRAVVAHQDEPRAGERVQPVGEGDPVGGQRVGPAEYAAEVDAAGLLGELAKLSLDDVVRDRG